MSGQDEVGGYPFEAGQRSHSLLRIRRERSDLRSARSRRHRVRCERVADEERAEGGDVKRGAPRGVPGSQDDARAPRHVQDRTIPAGGDLFELRCTEPAAQDGEPQESDERSELDRAEPLRRVRHFTARKGGVHLMDRNRDPLVAAEPLREADVVGMAVGENERADIRDRPTHGRKLLGDVSVEAGDTGVDDRHLPRLLDEVRVDAAPVSQSMDASAIFMDQPSSVLVRNVA